jgi:hypothetical protein
MNGEENELDVGGVEIGTLVLDDKSMYCIHRAMMIFPLKRVLHNRDA